MGKFVITTTKNGEFTFKMKPHEVKTFRLV